MLDRKQLELIRFKVYADLKSETQRTYMGFLWWIIDPILFMGIFYLVFGVLLQRGTENFVAFLLVGLVFWRWFQNTVSGGAATILTGKSLMRQVHLPKIIFPLVSIFSDLFKFSLVFVLLLSFLWSSGFTPGWAYLALPAVMAVEFTLILGATCLVSSLVPLIPDLKNLVNHVLHLLLFVSGIFYSIERIPEQYQGYFNLNPIAVLLTAYRRILMNSTWPDWQGLGYVGALAVVLFLAALVVLKRLEYEYPKLVHG